VAGAPRHEVRPDPDPDRDRRRHLLGSAQPDHADLRHLPVRPYHRADAHRRFQPARGTGTTRQAHRGHVLAQQRYFRRGGRRGVRGRLRHRRPRPAGGIRVRRRVRRRERRNLPGGPAPPSTQRTQGHQRTQRAQRARRTLGLGRAGRSGPGAASWLTGSPGRIRRRERAPRPRTRSRGCRRRSQPRASRYARHRRRTAGARPKARRPAGS